MVLNGLEIIDRQAYIDQWEGLPYDTKTEADIKLDVYFSREAPVLGHKEGSTATFAYIKASDELKALKLAQSFIKAG